MASLLCVHKLVESTRTKRNATVQVSPHILNIVSLVPVVASLVKHNAALTLELSS